MIPIHVSESMTKDTRRDLIRYKVPFVVPNKQLYLPDLGIDFREWLVKQRIKPTQLAPKTQLTAIAAILDKQSDLQGIGALASKYGYSIPTASRVVKELESLGVMERKRHGKEQLCMWNEDAKERWELLLPYFSSPVYKVHIAELPADLKNTLPIAGLSALSHYSRIGEPNHTVHACPNVMFQKIVKQGSIRLPDYATENSIMLQVWHYDPMLLAQKGIVDPLSLYLSLKDDPDDRTQTCLKEMLENLLW